MPPRLEIAPGCFVGTDSNVVELARPESVDAAWQAFAALASRLPDHPELLTDRPFMEELTRAEAKWKRLFMHMEGRA